MSSLSKVLDLVERSVIVQGIVTLGLVGSDIYLAIASKPIPELLSQTTLLVLGFYFGSKLGIETARASYSSKSGD